MYGVEQDGAVGMAWSGAVREQAASRALEQARSGLVQVLSVSALGSRQWRGPCTAAQPADFRLGSEVSICVWGATAAGPIVGSRARPPPGSAGAWLLIGRSTEPAARVLRRRSTATPQTGDAPAAFTALGRGFARKHCPFLLPLSTPSLVPSLSLSNRTQKRCGSNLASQLI